MMTLGTFCSGIGAPECAGMGEPLWFSEIDPFPSAVLAHRFPGVPNLGDMTAPDLLERIAEVGLPDIIVAGLPCQPFSVAGLRKGLEDPRNLTVRFVELADAIDDLRCAAGQRPVWWCVENVPGLLSDGDNAFGALLGGLVGDDAAIDRPAGGWTNAGVVAGPRRVAAWRVLDAQHFGVAQRRRRVFVLALGGAGAWACADALLPIADSLSGHPAPSREAGKGIAGTLAGGARSGGGYSEDDIPHVARCLNAKGGGGRIDGELSVGANQTTGFIGDCVAHSLRAEGFDASEDGTGRGTPLVPVAFSCKDHGADAGETAPTLRAMGHSGSHANAGGQVAVAFHENQRGELTVNDTAGSLKVGGGKPGQGYPAIAFHARQDPDHGPVTHPLDTDGHSIGVADAAYGDRHADATQARSIEALRALRGAAPEETLGQWCLGVLATFWPQEVLRSEVHGGSIRCAAQPKRGLVNVALSCAQAGSAWSLRDLWEAGCDGCPSPGWQPSEQLAGELGAYLSWLPHAPSPAETFLHDMWQASEGAGLLRQALSAVQKARRSVCGEGQPAHGSAAVRRLVPDEAEALQGFPRGYTNIVYRGKPAADGPRYKALGNSMAVPCMRYIGERIRSQSLQR